MSRFSVDFNIILIYTRQKDICARKEGKKCQLSIWLASVPGKSCAVLFKLHLSSFATIWCHKKRGDYNLDW